MNLLRLRLMSRRLAGQALRLTVLTTFQGLIGLMDFRSAFVDINKILCSGDFSLYDHVLDHSAAFNVIPKRYVGLELSALDVYFAMGRGRQSENVDVPASEMKKW